MLSLRFWKADVDWPPDWMLMKEQAIRNPFFFAAWVVASCNAIGCAYFSMAFLSSEASQGLGAILSLGFMIDLPTPPAWMLMPGPMDGLMSPSIVMNGFAAGVLTKAGMVSLGGAGGPASTTAPSIFGPQGSSAALARHLWTLACFGSTFASPPAWLFTLSFAVYSNAKLGQARLEALLSAAGWVAAWCFCGFFLCVLLLRSWDIRKCRTLDAPRDALCTRAADGVRQARPDSGPAVAGVGPPCWR